ncbi:MAG TPA: amidohydrolase family protein [Thermoanaerobaculia bacterium]|nr:amidohydrolase family protein [Thermoanaerobaculia bacterium]
MSNKRVLLLLLAFAFVSCATQRRSTVLMSGKRAGTQVVTTRGNEVTVDFEYNDRGRGPKTHTVMKLKDEVPVSMQTTGNDYLKQKIEERFTVENGMAVWKNTSESGQDEPGKLYASMYGPPEEAGILTAAVLRAGGKMPIAGGGEVSVRKVGDANLRGTHVAAYEVSGFGLQPFEVWLDDQNHYFGTVSSWFSTIREGFEGDIKQLVDAQDARKRERGKALAAKLTRRPAGDRLLVTNARIFDPRTGTVSEPRIIVVEGNRIVSVDNTGTARNAADLIDAGGKVVLPGLWDMHVHIGETDSMLQIAAGVTSARDLGNDADSLLELKRKIENGEAIGPRLVMAGLIDGRGQYQGPTKLLVDTEEEGRQVIDVLVSKGYEGLKIYSSIKPELVPFLTRYAHEKGLRVSGHIPAGMTASQAVDAGYDEIQHVNMLFLNFMPDVKETRTPARFTEPANRGADLDVNSAEVRAFLAKLKAKNVTIDPTVNVFENMFTARTGSLDPSYAMIADRLPPQIRRTLYTGGLPVPEGKDLQYRASFQRMLDFIKAAHDAGVTIVAGTDAFSGFALHREFELYVLAGLTPAEVLRLATLTPAELLKRDKDLGTIEPGKLADFIFVDGDPTKNISDIRKVTTVVKDGKVYDAKAVYAELGIR